MWPACMQVKACTRGNISKVHSVANVAAVKVEQALCLCSEAGRISADKAVSFGHRGASTEFGQRFTSRAKPATMAH